LLVEGPSEQFLIPPLIKHVMQLNLDEEGIAVIPIYGTHFGAYAKYSDPMGIAKKCAVVADGDLVPSDANPTATIEEDGGGDAAVAPAIHELDVAENEFVQTFQCETTFERELTMEGTLQCLKMLPTKLERLTSQWQFAPRVNQ